jgi:predicted dehydrogenase
VFIEKPIALTMEKANEMVESVEENDVKSQVGFLSRFGDAVEKVKKMVDNNESGTVGLMTGKYMCNALHAPWWREKSKSGGQIVEQIIHTYDVIRYFMGDIKSVYCSHNNVFHKDVERYTSEDVSGTVITFKSGAVATVSGTNGGIPGQWLSQYELVAKNITVNFAGPNHATMFKTDVSPVEKVEIRGNTNTMLAETLDLIDAIESGGETRTPMIEGAKSLELVLAASKSGETGQIIEF